MKLRNAMFGWFAALAVAGMALPAVGEDQTASAQTPVAGPVVKAQTVCPVMKGPINKEIYMDADGKRIYVCCRACLKAVKKDPAKYIQKLESEGITLDKAVSDNQEAAPKK